MNRLTFTICSLAAGLLLVLCPFGNPAMATKKDDGPIWHITWTNISPADQLLVKDDHFRLKRMKDGGYKFTPQKDLRVRWEAALDYKVELTKQGDDLYCGNLKVKRGGHEYTHGMSLSEIIPDARIVLHIYHLSADDACTFKEHHGGLAHGEP